MSLCTTEIYNQQTSAELLEEIMEQGDRFTEWETEFLDSLYNLDRNYTLPEHRKLVEIHERRIQS